LLGLVAAGEGLAVVPEVILRDVRHDRGWTVKPLSAPRPRVEVDAVWNPANPSAVLSHYLELLTRPGPRTKEPASAGIKGAG
ncbi:MAG TPA: LysR substrate-binding domain-containing protein, partial [Chthoniobacterales bacterium]